MCMVYCETKTDSDNEMYESSDYDDDFDDIIYEISNKISFTDSRIDNLTESVMNIHNNHNITRIFLWIVFAYLILLHTIVIWYWNLLFP